MDHARTMIGHTLVKMTLTAWGFLARLVWHWPRRGILAALRGVRWVLLVAWLWLCVQGCLLRASPFGVYRASVRRRDWVQAKIVYLQEESGKWRALFTAAKLPYTALRSCGLNPQACIGILVAGSAVGGGVIAAEVLEGRSFSRGDAGVYSAPADIPTSYSDSDSTLRVNLGATAVGEIVIENVTVGTAFAGSTLPSSASSNVVNVGGTAASSGFTATWLEVGHLTVDRWRCTTFELSNTEVHTLNIIGNASDGQSISPVPGVPRARAIGGGNRADSMRTSGGTYDHIVIGAPTSNVNGKVDVLTLSNIFTKGGACKLSRIKAGTIDILLNETGGGTGFSSKDFVIATTVTYKNFLNKDNVEVSISPP